MAIRSVLTPLFFFLFASTTVVAQQKNNVRIINDPSRPYIELRNGLMGLVIPKESSYNSSTPEKTLAPIQSVIYADGSYSDNTPNYFQALSRFQVYPTGMKVSISKNSPEECVVVVRYSFAKPQFKMGEQTYKGGDAGKGYYQSTISLSKNSKSAIIEEDSDYDFSYEVKISNGLNPDKARYRGHNSASPEYGYEPNGSTYQAGAKKIGLDATVDLNYAKPREFYLLSLWDPGGGESNTGRYWQVFNNAAPASANLVGFFQGKPSRLIGATWVGVQLVTKPSEADNTIEKNTASLRLLMVRRGPDNVWYPRKRFQWGLFVSTKTDLLPADQFQPIAKELNYKSGFTTKVDDYASRPAIASATFFEGALYLPAAKMQQLITRIKTDEAFYRSMINIDPYFKAVADSWRFPDSARSTIKYIINWGEEVKDILKNKDGINTHEIRYWMGGRSYKYIALLVSGLFADKQINISAAQKEALLEVTRMLARLMWDEDYVPMNEGAGVNYGPENMYYMFKNNGRNFFALIFANDPEFRERAKRIVDETRGDLLNAIAEDGSAYGTPHYIQAAIDPIFFTMLQLKQAGIADLFKEQQQRIGRFVDFYKSILTPPSVRYKGFRKLIALGDGSEESAPTFALIATGLRDIDPKMSAELMGIFQHGAPRLSIFGFVAMSFDLSTEYPLNYSGGSSNYPAYLSHMRKGINSNNETALWFVHGERYKDHRHDDRGQVAIYALKAPLSVSSSSLYEPRADDARIKSVVVPGSLFPEWNNVNQPVNIATSKGNPWKSSQQLQFADLGKAVSSIATMKGNNSNWQRRVSMISVEEERPVIVLFDSLEGNENYIWSMPFMSQGAIKTPAGNITPMDKIWDTRNAGRKELPQATPEQNLQRGLNVFSFTGQPWPQSVHPYGGIDWKLYSLSSTGNSFTISQWTNTWQNALETQEFQQTNGKPYSETQQILRIKTQQPLFNVILPYAKGKESATVKQVGANRLQLQWDNAIMEITPNSYAYANDSKTIAASFSDAEVKEKNISIWGGPAEVEWAGRKILIRVHGNSGRRRIVVPARITPDFSNKAIKLNVEGGNTIITIPYDNKNTAKLSTENGYTEFSFSVK